MNLEEELRRARLPRKRPGISPEEDTKRSQLETGSNLNGLFEALHRVRLRELRREGVQGRSSEDTREERINVQ